MTPACRVRFAPISIVRLLFAAAAAFFVFLRAAVFCCLDDMLFLLLQFGFEFRFGSSFRCSRCPPRIRKNDKFRPSHERIADRCSRRIRSKSRSHRENEIRPRALTGWCRRVIVHAADAGYEAISVQIANPRATVAVTSPQLQWPQSCRLRSPQCLVVYSRLSVASIARARARAIPGASTRIDPCGFVQTG